ncbi:hypothetical protein A9979_13455 [Pseudomonas sp. UMC76]|nr:hypothetical protein [Pseudomonas sp. UMC76]
MARTVSVRVFLGPASCVMRQALVLASVISQALDQFQRRFQSANQLGAVEQAAVGVGLCLGAEQHALRRAQGAVQVGAQLEAFAALLRVLSTWCLGLRRAGGCPRGSCAR